MKFIKLFEDHNGVYSLLSDVEVIEKYWMVDPLEFKDIIMKKLEEARSDYELLKATISHKDDHGTDDTSPTFKLLEDGSDVLSKEDVAECQSIVEAAGFEKVVDDTGFWVLVRRNAVPA